MQRARIEYWKVSAESYKALMALEKSLKDSGTDERLIHLTKLRASQINRCAFCIDMHWRDLRALGEPEHRLYALDAWRESPHYSEKERALLEWVEAVTRDPETLATDGLFERVRKALSEKELSDITVAIGAINAWNRLAIAMRMPVPTPRGA